MPAIQELKNRDERTAKEMDEAFERAKAKAGECDGVLIILQKKASEGGGMFYEAMPSMRFETISYLATAFLHGFHGGPTRS